MKSVLATLGENDIPYMDGDVAMVVNPTLFADILNPSAGIAQYFIRNDAVGEGNRGLRSGLVGSLYGIDVYMSNAFGTGGNANTILRCYFSSYSVCYSFSAMRLEFKAEYSM